MENYEKIRVVGRGACGTVRLCRRLSDQKEVIIKQIPLEQMDREERMSALNEVKVHSMLHHLNIIKYFENFLEDQALMIVMEYAEGGTLHELLQQRKGALFEEEEIMKYFTQILLAMQHVHSKWILHRDIKAQNILLGKKKEVLKMGDFGISKVLTKSKAISVVGTPSYISPELCEGKPYNQKSDIWALGCILYEITTLKKTFEAQTLPALVMKIMRGTFAPVADHYSQELSELILSMLQLDPAKRPNINQIMAAPIVTNSLLTLVTDMGKLPCKRMQYNKHQTGPKHPQRTPSHKHHTSSDIVYCWGGSSCLQLPTKLQLPNSDTSIQQLSTSRASKAAVIKTGRLFVWEDPLYGMEPVKVGEDTVAPFIPRFLEGSQSAVSIQYVSCGDDFTACVTDRGILMTFGNGANGCLGHGNYSDVSQAKIVEKLLGCEVVNVSCGRSHIMAVTNEYEVYSWGRADNGRLGLDTKESTVFNQPQEVTSVSKQCKPVCVRCGNDASLLITEEGRLYCTGSNRFNKLALDNEESRKEFIYSFQLVTTPCILDSVVKCIGLGTSHTAIVNDEGACYTVGSNQFGQLGNGKVDNNRHVIKVEGLESYHINKVACGDTFTVVASTDGRLFSWGKADRGRLGHTDPNGSVPKPVQIPEKSGEIVSLSSSHGTTVVAIKT